MNQIIERLKGLFPKKEVEGHGWLTEKVRREEEGGTMGIVLECKLTDKKRLIGFVEDLFKEADLDAYNRFKSGGRFDELRKSDFADIVSSVSRQITGSNLRVELGYGTKSDNKIALNITNNHLKLGLNAVTFVENYLKGSGETNPNRSRKK